MGWSSMSKITSRFSRTFTMSFHRPSPTFSCSTFSFCIALMSSASHASTSR
jgi:hypothetical protein